jgi:hypothetical protein
MLVSSGGCGDPFPDGGVGVAIVMPDRVLGRGGKTRHRPIANTSIYYKSKFS